MAALREVLAEQEALEASRQQRVDVSCEASAAKWRERVEEAERNGECLLPRRPNCLPFDESWKKRRASYRRECKRQKELVARAEREEVERARRAEREADGSDIRSGICTALYDIAVAQGELDDERGASRESGVTDLSIRHNAGRRVFYAKQSIKEYRAEWKSRFGLPINSIRCGDGDLIGLNPLDTKGLVVP